MQNPSVKPPPSAPLLSQDGWAEVRASDQVVRYRRTGSGRPTLLLYSAGEAQGLWPEVIDALASSYRLIVPAPAGRGTDVEAWLVALIDGLGVANLSVIATEAFGLAPIEATLRRCDHVARVVLVSTRDVSTPASIVDAPLLVLRRDQPADGILPRLLDFLGGNDTGRRA